MADRRTLITDIEPYEFGPVLFPESTVTTGSADPAVVVKAVWDDRGHTFPEPVANPAARIIEESNQPRGEHAMPIIEPHTPTIHLGETYRDDVTGFEGVATAVVTYLHGPPRVCLEAIHEGAIKADYVDAERLTMTVRD